jgi:hypothetical protein
MICIMIGPSGLLIVVSHLYVILVSFMGAHWGCQKKKKLDLDALNIFVGSHFKLGWGCCYTKTMGNCPKMWCYLLLCELIIIKIFG